MNQSVMSAVSNGAAATQQPLTYQPHVDVCDTGGEVRIVADIPGAKADGIDVTFADGVLSIQAAVPARDLPGRVVCQEYGIGDYRRAFQLGDGFDPALVTADYRAGVLTVRVPRLAAVKPRKVEVRSS